MSTWLQRLRRIDGVVVAILLLGAGLRLQYVSAPLAEAHSWRQLLNADVARNFSGPEHLLYPEVSWGGTDRYAGLEMPLFQGLVAVVYQVVGVREIVGRLASIIVSVLTIGLLFLLGRALGGPGVGRASAFLFAVSPSAVFFGRTFLSDVPMLALSVATVLAWHRYLRSPSGRRAVVGGVTAALACLVKLPAVVAFPPIAYLAWQASGWRIVRDPRVLGAAVVVLGVTVAWYWHAEAIQRSTGLGVAIFTPSGTYREPIASLANPWHQPSIWTASLSDPAPIVLVLERLGWLHLGPLGVVGCLLGLLRAWRTAAGRAVLIWVAGALVMIGATIPGQADNEYYQLPLLPAAALLWGFGVGPWFERPALGFRARAVGVAVAAAILVGAVGGLRWSRVVPDYFRPGRLDYNTIVAGASIDRHLPPGALLTTVHMSRSGVNSPILLYRAGRRGWSFDRQAISRPVIEYLATRGARYVAVVDWPALLRDRPEVAEFLKTHRVLPVESVHNNVALFELRVRVSPLPRMQAVVEDVVAARPDLVTAPCEAGTPGPFLAAVLDRLRQHDRRWGYNWRRGLIGDFSRNALAHHWGPTSPEGSTDVHVVQLMLDECGSEATPVWMDVTVETAMYGVTGRWTLAPRWP